MNSGIFNFLFFLREIYALNVDINLNDGETCHIFDRLFDILLCCKCNIRNTNAIFDDDIKIDRRFFLADFDGKSVGEPKDLLEGTLFESPLRPFGGMEQFAWSPDGKTIAYTCRKKTGVEYARSTDSDIYLYNIEDGSEKNICKECGANKNMGYDTNPSFSPDGVYNL